MNIDMRNALHRARLHASILAFAATLSLAGLATAQIAGPVVPLSAPSARAEYPALAADSAGGIHAVWIESGEIRYAHSTNGGLTFSPSVRVSVGGYPDIAVAPSGKLFVVWGDSRPYLSTSTDGGITFTPPQQLGNGLPQANVSTYVTVAAPTASNVVVLWSATDDVVYRVHSSDGGQTFSAPLAVSAADQRSYYPDVAASSGVVSAAWTSFVPPNFGSQIQYCRSTDGGLTFQTPLVLASAAGGGSQSVTVAASPAGAIHAVWYDQVGQIGHRRSLDGGVSFEPTQLIMYVFPGGAPDVAAGGSGQVGVVANASGDLLFTRSLDSGSNFTSPLNVSASPELTGRGRVAWIGAERFGVVYAENIAATPRVVFRTIYGAPVPTLVSLASTRVTPGRVEITWFSDDRALESATVHRCAGGTGLWDAVGRVQADGTGKLTFEDTRVSPGTRYGYRLGILQGGVEAFLAETWVDVPPVAVLALERVTPSPTTRDLVVRFSLPDGFPAGLDLLDLAGRRVRHQEVGSMGPGYHAVKLDSGQRLSAGIYLVRLTSGPRSLTTKAVVIR